jgi:hypothetical protein
VDIIRVIALLLHPILASALVAWVWWQYSWRKKSHELKGDERAEHLRLHEKRGAQLLWSAVFVALVAVAGRAVAGWRTHGDFMAEIWPTSVHGITGPIGIIILWKLSSMGKETKAAREQGESFSNLKTKHGRMADLVIALVFIHAFLGFLYIFDVLG